MTRNIIYAWPPRMLRCAVPRPTLPICLLDRTSRKSPNGSAVGPRKVWAEIGHIDLRIGIKRWNQKRHVYLAEVVSVWGLPIMDDEPLCITIFQTFPRQAEITEVALICLW